MVWPAEEEGSQCEHRHRGVCMEEQRGMLGSREVVFLKMGDMEAF